MWQAFFIALIRYLVEGFTDLYRAYTIRQEIVQGNEERIERLKDAKTREEQQRANNDISSHLGG